MQKKKSLGQNFLRSPHYLAAIVDAANVSKGDKVLEVGPGDGALTAALLARGATVVAVEKDHRLIAVLQEKFAKEIQKHRFILHEADALEFNFSVDTAGIGGLYDDEYKVVANIPYYITGALLRKFLTAHTQFTTIVVLVQLEVAQRIVAKPTARGKGGKESILSLSVKAYGKPTLVKKVPRGAFAPPPNVDSAILLIEQVSRKNFVSAAHEQRFFDLVHAGFAQKRKLLKRNLEPLLGKDFSNRLKLVGIADTARAEDVPLAQWLALSKPVQG